MSQTQPDEIASATITPGPGEIAEDDLTVSISPSSSGSPLSDSLTSASSAAQQSFSSNASDTHSQTSSTSAVPHSSISLIPANAAAGGLFFTQPPLTVTSYYKIAQSQFITFGWNYTGLSVTPTKLTFSAVCENGNTYPVGPTDGVIEVINREGNSKITDGTPTAGAPGSVITEVVWDVSSYQIAHPDKPLVQANYTLHVWDERGPNAARKGGHFEHNSAVRFALYTPQPYIPLASGWTCAACSGASSYEPTHPASISLAITLFVTFLSGLHLIRSKA